MTEAQQRKKEKIDYIIDQCKYLRAKEKLTINNFGKRQDLKLYIWKNANYNQEKNKDNTVRIETKRFGIIEDKTDEIPLSKLKEELERIYIYKNYSE